MAAKPVGFVDVVAAAVAKSINYFNVYFIYFYFRSSMLSLKLKIPARSEYPLNPAVAP